MLAVPSFSEFAPAPPSNELASIVDTSAPEPSVNTPIPLVRAKRRAHQALRMLAVAVSAAAATAFVLSILLLRNRPDGVSWANAAIDVPELRTVTRHDPMVLLAPSREVSATQTAEAPLPPAASAQHESAAPMPGYGASPATLKPGIAAPRAASPRPTPARPAPPVDEPDEAVSAVATEISPFDPSKASQVLDDAQPNLDACSQRDLGSGTVRVAVTFAPTGRVTTAVVEAPGPFAGTPIIGCIVGHLRTVQVAPFSGDNVTVHRTFTVP
jgi:hypothetical protein